MRPWLYGFYMAAALVAVCASAAVGVIMGTIRSLPPLEKLENYTPPEITQIFDRNGSTLIGEFSRKDTKGNVIRRQVVPLKEIPRQLRNAFIAIEDRRFYSHCGIDLIGVVRALSRNLASGHPREGASTLSQQLARNVLPIGREKTFKRKFIEAVQTIRIEKRYSKDQILEFYLNQIDFGSNSFGVCAAADKYFSKPLRELTLAQCAVLAAIPKATSNYNPLMHPDESKSRRNLVLEAMRAQGYITPKEYQAALAESLGLHPSNRATSRYPYFMDALERDLKGNYHLDRTTLTRGGLRINATIDPAIQNACDDALRKGLVEVEKIWQAGKPERQTMENKKWNGVLRKGDFKLMEIVKITEDEVKVRLNRYRGTLPLPDPLPFYNPERAMKPGQLLDVQVEDVDDRTGEIKGKFAFDSPVQGTMVVLDAHNGEVLALVGGTNNFYSNHGGWFNNAVQGGRQVGSCFKPFVYAAAFERGDIGPNDIIIDEQVEYGSGKQIYRPTNYSTEGYVGPITLIRAMEESRNVPMVRLFEGLGPKRALSVVQRFDFLYDQPQWKLLPELSTCLGTIDSSPLEMASAYQVFANMGIGIRPQFFRSIVDGQGHVPIPLRRREVQVLKPITACQMQYMMRKVVMEGTGKNEIGNKLKSPPYPPICGKTGTTSACKDAWFIGYTPDLVISCQVGFTPKLSMGKGMSGGRMAGPIWREAFKEIIKTRKDWHMTFDNVPEGAELVDICKETGKRASSRCSASGHEIFAKVPFAQGKAPVPCDGEHLMPVIASTRGGGGKLSGYARSAGGGPAAADASSGDNASSGDEGDDTAGNADTPKPETGGEGATNGGSAPGGAAPSAGVNLNGL